MIHAAVTIRGGGEHGGGGAKWLTGANYLG